MGFEEQASQQDKQGGGGGRLIIIRENDAGQKAYIGPHSDPRIGRGFLVRSKSKFGTNTVMTFMTFTFTLASVAIDRSWKD